MSLIHCEINVILTWSANCIVTNFTGGGAFTITDTKHDLLVVI